MEYLIALLCLCTIFGPVLLGVGFSLVAERYIGRWAYVVGGLLPIIIIAILYGAYDVALRVTACEPSDSLACGQPLGAAFLFSVGFLCVTIIASASAQAAVFLFMNGLRQPQMQQYMEPGMEDEMSAGMQGYAQPGGYSQPDTFAQPDDYSQPNDYAPPDEYAPPGSSSESENPPNWR